MHGPSPDGPVPLRPRTSLWEVQPKPQPPCEVRPAVEEQDRPVSHRLQDPEGKGFQGFVWKVLLPDLNRVRPALHCPLEDGHKTVFTHQVTICDED